MTPFKPMLADEVDLGRLVFPVLASAKLDGVRATFIDGKLKTRSLKPLPNPRVDEMFHCSHRLDGELIVGSPTDKDVFRNTMKVVSSHTADAHGLIFCVFDLVEASVFTERLAQAHRIAEQYAHMKNVPHVLIETMGELLTLEDDVLSEGYEGLMLRSPNGRYKYGRATTSEGTLLKLKRKSQSEAWVIGFEEQMHNANEAKVDNLGYTERSSHQANKIPMGVLGALVVRDMKTGVEFNVGTGFTHEERRHIWENQGKYRDKIISYEYLAIGVKDKPRHPTFLAFRMVEDT
jgi:DNA ligase-1